MQKNAYTESEIPYQILAFPPMVFGHEKSRPITDGFCDHLLPFLFFLRPSTIVVKDPFVFGALLLVNGHFVVFQVIFHRFIELHHFI